MNPRLLLLAAFFFPAQTALFAQAEKTLKKVLELKIPREGGANGAAVAWHPLQKKYYAAMAGNSTYPLAVYDITGKKLSVTDQQTLFDIRGMWYNPKTRTIQMNGYNEFGWAEYELDARGLPRGIKEIADGMNQPSEQCAGAFNPSENAVYFLNDEAELEKYDAVTAQYMDASRLYLGKKKGDDIVDYMDDLDLEDYNLTTVIFTGTRGAELGILNHLERSIGLYDLSTGYMTRRLRLPADAPVSAWLNFSYCNNIFWLFDKEARVWMGYK